MTNDTPSPLNREIAIMRALFQRGAAVRPVSLMRWMHKHVVPLWRRGLIEVWYRQSLDPSHAFDGPFYTLTIHGAYVASKFCPAPRGSTGAET